MKESNGVVTNEWNAREIARTAKASVTVHRAKAQDEAIQEAYRGSLPIRMVICEGKKRSDPDSTASKVSLRLLDPEPWHVAKYNQVTGQCTLMRGLGNGTDRYADQFDMPQPIGGPAEKISKTSSAYVRRPEVRRFSLIRANGRCEYCGKEGFLMQGGKVYLETHHVVPLHEGGSDTVNNVAALCPNHHREAHHGTSRAEIRNTLLEKLASLAPNNSLQTRRP
jgi:5-methylcytosine-specific restriction enzyme A